MNSAYNNNYPNEIFSYSTPILAMDIVIFTIYKSKLCVVLRMMEDEDKKIKYVLPGGIVRKGLSLDENFNEIMYKQTGIQGAYCEQLSIFGDPDRDPRGHVISASYFSLLNKDDFLNSADFTQIQILEYSKLDTIEIGFHFDHKNIIQSAKHRLNYKLEYTKIAKNLVPLSFTLPYLHSIYEIVLGEKIDQRNFRKKILFLGIVQETGLFDRKSSYRPAKLYEFTNNTIGKFGII